MNTFLLKVLQVHKAEKAKRMRQDTVVDDKTLVAERAQEKE